MNFKEPFNVVIKHLFTAVGVEWKTIIHFYENISSGVQGWLHCLLWGYFKAFLAVRKLRDLKIPAQALPTFWLPTHSASESCLGTNRRIMEMIWDFQPIPLLEQSGLGHSGRISVALTVVWKAYLFVFILLYYCIIALLLHHNII